MKTIDNYLAPHDKTIWLLMTLHYLSRQKQSQSVEKQERIVSLKPSLQLALPVVVERGSKDLINLID